MTPTHRIALIALALGASALACGRNWDDFDPRIDEAAAGTGATTGSGGGGGQGAGGGGTGGQGGGPDALCGGVGVLVDDFEGIGENPLMAGSWQKSNGQLTIQVPPGENFGNYGSRAYYTMEGRAVSLELVSVPLDAGFFFSVDTDSNDWMEFFLADGTLRAVRCENEQCDFPQSAPFDADNHRFLQLRQQGGTIYFEVSADGVSWQPFGSAPDLGATELFTLNFGFYDETPSMDDREIVLAGLSAVPEQHCPANFDDDFNDDAIHPRWSRFTEESVDIEEKDGQLEFDMEIGVSTQGGSIETKSAFDIRGASITIELVEGVNEQDPGQAIFALRSLDEEHELILNPFMGTLNLIEKRDGDTEITEISYDEQNMRWLRFREDNGYIYFEVAPSAMSRFSIVHTAMATFDTTATRIIVGGAGASMGLPFSHEVRFDNFSARVP